MGLEGTGESDVTSHAPGRVRHNLPLVYRVQRLG